MGLKSSEGHKAVLLVMREYGTTMDQIRLFCLSGVDICLVCRAHGMNERIIPRSLVHTTTVVIMMV